jgi:transcription elongation GreA/GreB family factor
MREEFEKLVAAGKISRQHLEPLILLAQGGYCMSRSWGFGKITTVDTVFARFTIDFHGKTGHTMDLSFAAETLKPISADHVLARKASDLGALRQMAALNHLDLIKLVLQSNGGRATLDQVQQMLVPDVITEDWKKWWEVAKREMKKDGHFVVPTKKTDPIIYQSQEVSLQERTLTDLRAAKGLKLRIAVAADALKSISDLKDPKATATEIISALNADINSHLRNQTALALEAMFVRDDLRTAAGLAPQEGEHTPLTIWMQSPRLAQFMEQVSAAKHRRALLTFQMANPDRWAESLLAILNNVSAKLCGECATLLIQGGKLQEFKEAVTRLISQHSASSELLLWLGKERSDTFADILGPEVFRAMLTAMERDQFNEKRSNKLRDFILDDQELLVELIGSADIDVIKDLTRSLQLSPSFDDMDKRSLLARIVKSYPAMQALISGEQTKQDNTLQVSWASLERRKHEYEELVKRKIPANSKDIAIARSYGDLRENHEYKAAKEMQKVIMRRKSELESQLLRARGTDFANVRTDVASLGSKVTVTDLATSNTEAYSIFGAWDSEPDLGVISYLSPIAKALLGHKVGDEVECELDNAKRRMRIERIEVAPPYTPPAITETAPEPETVSH